MKTAQKTVTKYIAEDGMQFDTEWQCEAHEKEMAVREIGCKTCDELIDKPNFDGGEYTGHNDFTWYYPKSTHDIDKLRKAYHDEFHEISYDLIDTWICIESDSDGCFWVTTLDDGINYAKNILEKLGYEMVVNKKGEGYENCKFR